MQLEKIKLSGFKSFVDPMVIPVSSPLVAVVGPNGCGKSNIIDAVCWVMGESSAKYLRGESLTDVIFNGSSARKPIGQASVELIFDNSAGTLTGEYASYSEISIRRVLSRDGESTYYLNGARCRRRDITDIFAGTGLGPRSYSIIGQNMISRLIEAKPDDMRVYLEEAAGISKYKERRRETENRINHTQENLARLNDISSELEKQLASLKRQAGSAEKFKQLKEQERLLQAQCYAIQWRELDIRIVDDTLKIQQQETGLESCQAALSEVDLGVENRREDQRQANETFQEVQKRYYLAGNEITRIEQEIRHAQERQQQLQHDIEQIDKDSSQVSQDLEQSEDESHDLEREIGQVEPELQLAKESTIKTKAQLSQAESAMQSWQDNWDSFNQKNSKAVQAAQVEQTRIQHLESSISSLKQRQEKLTIEQNQINFDELTKAREELTQKVSDVSVQAKDHNEKLTEARNAILQCQQAQQDISNNLNQLRNQLQRLRGEQASLQALQQTALGQRDQRMVEWLSQHQLDKLPRLAQGVDVEAGWELAVEKVLGYYLQAVCVKSIKELSASITDLKEGNLCLFVDKSNTNTSSNKASALINKVKSQWSLDSLLGNIYAVDSLPEALALSDTLGAGESVITRDGLWLGHNWMRVARDKNPEAGVFQREQELKKINQQITQLLAEEVELETKLAEVRSQLSDFEAQRDQLQKMANDYQSQVAQLSAELKMKQERLVELEKRAAQFVKDQQEIAAQLQKTETDLQQARASWQQALNDVQHDTEQKVVLLQERDELREKLHSCREALSQAQQSVQQLEIRLQTAKSQQASLQQNTHRLQQQLATLTERKATLTQESGNEKSIQLLQDSLSAALSHRLVIEEELQAKRATVDALDQELRTLETRRHDVSQEISKYRDRLETLRLDWQGTKVKSENILEQLQHTQYELEAILKELPQEAVAAEWESQLEQVTQRINRLGPINLVAIEEFATCSERKQYLDKQVEDLQQALAMLQDAIAKIDKETRARFKETFDKVNERFQELFPKIFGGGRSSLELTDDNLLEAGVTVMACPPGKRNSTIHLLSGGEKAMTAIALVFSIFHLNPAPFCLLDEVDAPLDDANINRFCQLVKTMAAKTQFLFISHNKLAIEMAEQLIGVTMNEPGVSRLVSVNIEEAIQMAGA